MSSPATKRDGDPALALPEFSDEELRQIAAGAHANPHGILGAHPVAVDGSGDHVTVIRTLRPAAQKVVAIMTNGGRLELMHLAHGIWQGLSALAIGPYTIEARYDDGSVWSADDPYRHLPRIGELDLHLIGEGRHERLWDALGAHLLPATDHSPAGCSFTVWAPNAQAVRVVGDFNGWNGVGHAMRTMGATGVWELFVPGLEVGSNYKFEILSPDGHWLTRADPMARYTEVPPATASIVGVSDYEWGDDAWMTARAEIDPHNSPMSVYEVHLGSWRPGLNYRDAADQLIEYVQELGFTHIEFMPLAEHPFGGSWGYQITSYYAATSRFGHPDDLKYLIDRLHQAGIGVLMDWVPGHFPKDEWALARFDGRAVYEHPDPRRGEQLDWGTLVFDFGRPEVRNFLVANALFWLEEFHVDGLRVDAVASMLYLDYSREEGQWAPNKYGGRENLEAIDFLQEVTATSYRRNPGIVMIAEESTSWGGVTAATSAGGLGFGMKWNMGWMHDSLRYMQVDPMYRSHHHSELTFSFLYAFSENFMLPISHDEVVHGKGSLARKMPGDRWQQLANVRAYLAFMWSHPGKKLLFMGQEFAQLSEWNEQHGLDWWILDQPAHRGVFELVAALNRLYRVHPALWEQDNSPAGFQWIDGSAAIDNVVSFLRWDGEGRPIAVIVNFSGTPHHDYRVGLPQSGRWQELLNTDAPQFGGSGVGNFGGVVAEENGWNGLPASAVLSLPPLGALWLSPSTVD